MGSFGKFIGGGLGFAMGGPIGALIGFAVGSIFDSSSVNVSTSRSQRNRTAEGDFKMSLLVLMASILKADGKIMKAELDVAKRFLVANFGEEGALDALQILKKLLEQHIDEEQVAIQVNQYMNYSSKLELVHLLFQIAYADGDIHPKELAAIQRISATFRIDRLDFESLKAPYMKKVDSEWAYKALEIEPKATNDDVKKAYRRMAMKFHPDKVNDLGDDVKKTATEKFRSVNEAYESIKKERGIS